MIVIKFCLSHQCRCIHILPTSVQNEWHWLLAYLEADDHQMRFLGKCSCTWRREEAYQKRRGRNFTENAKQTSWSPSVNKEEQLHANNTGVVRGSYLRYMMFEIYGHKTDRKYNPVIDLFSRISYVLNEGIPTATANSFLTKRREWVSAREKNKQW